MTSIAGCDIGCPAGLDVMVGSRAEIIGFVELSSVAAFAEGQVYDETGRTSLEQGGQT